MASESKQIKQATKTLHRLQDEQVKSVRQVGSLRGKLARRSRQMQSLEEKMAKLEQRVYGLRNPGGQPIAQFAKGLRPARLIINSKSGSFAKLVESPEKLVAMLRAPWHSSEGLSEDLEQSGAPVGARGSRQSRSAGHRRGRGWHHRGRGLIDGRQPHHARDYSNGDHEQSGPRTGDPARDRAGLRAAGGGHYPPDRCGLHPNQGSNPGELIFWRPRDLAWPLLCRPGRTLRKASGENSRKPFEKCLN